MKARQEQNYSHFRNVRVGGDTLESGNGVDIRSSAASANPAIVAVGDDTNVSLEIQGKGTGGFSVVGDEANNGVLNIYADQGDDAADKWSVTALAASQTLEVSNANTTSKVAVSAGQVAVLGAEAGNAALLLDADEGDDNADSWFLQSTAADNDLDFINHTTTVANLTSAGALECASSIKSRGATGGIGYATGAGGTVTQITSITTGVTLNTVCGEIVTVSAGTAAGAEDTFDVTNSAVAATDVVVAAVKSTASAGTPVVFAHTAAAGSFKITISNLHATDALNNTLTLSFVVIKAVAA